MHVLCPECHNRIDLSEYGTLSAIQCPSCGSSVRLADISTQEHRPSFVQQLGDKFELLSVVGQGAFGTVYRARDLSLDRTVAVKVPRPGLWTDDHGRDRFLREARSAAQLRHASIVPLHEVGDIDGVPFLVSDYIEGMSLADVLTGKRLSFADAAELIAGVADALHYAHEQGVIHRDVKPSNILLDGHDRPYLMDFGLAKRDAGEVTMTVEGQVLGTPAYMSPEQARGAGHDVDGRSDVYSLGVILYQLLTGELPFRGNTRMLLHQVLHDEPRSPRRLNDRVPRDLETICLKCLEKEPPKRYATAAALADDLRRFRNGQPIQARPVGRVERGWRWCRRNPLAASLTAALILVFALGFGGVLWQWLEAETHLAEVGRQRQIAGDNLVLANKERKEADENFHEALKAVNDYFTIVSEDKILNSGLAGLQPLQKDLLEAALRYYQRLVAKRADDPALRQELALAYYRIGSITAELESQPEGLRLLRKALELCQELHQRDPADRELRAALVKIHTAIGKAQRNTEGFKTARESVQRALALQLGIVNEKADPEPKYILATLRNELGMLYVRRYQADQALAEFKEAVAILEPLARDHPRVGKYRNLLAGIQHNRGAVFQDVLREHDAALEAFEQALKLQEQLLQEAPFDPFVRDFLGRHLSAIGQAYVSKKQVAKAIPFYERSVTVHEKLVGENPAMTRFQHVVAVGYVALGRAYRLNRQFSAALDVLDKARRVYKQLLANNPANSEVRTGLAFNYSNLGHVYAGKWARRPAQEYRRLAVAEQKRVVEANKENLAFHSQLAFFLGELAEEEAQLGRLAGAAGSLRQALAVHDKLERAKFNNLQFPKHAAAHKQDLASLEKQLAKLTVSLKTVDSDIAELTGQLNESEMDDVRERLAAKLLERAWLHRALGNGALALRSTADSVKHSEYLVKEYAIIPKFRQSLISGCLALAYFNEENGRPKEATVALHKALTLAEKVTMPEALDLYWLACARAQLAARRFTDVEPAAEDEAKRQKLVDHAMQTLRQAVAAGFKDAVRLGQEVYLDPLREREDLQRFLAEVSKK